MAERLAMHYASARALLTSAIRAGERGAVPVRARSLLRAVTKDIAHVLLTEGHHRLLYLMWCHPERGLLRKCHPDPFEQHALGIRRCAACKRPL